MKQKVFRLHFILLRLTAPRLLSAFGPSIICLFVYFFRASFLIIQTIWLNEKPILWHSQRRTNPKNGFISRTFDWTNKINEKHFRTLDLASAIHLISTSLLPFLFAKIWIELKKTMNREWNQPWNWMLMYVYEN